MHFIVIVVEIQIVVTVLCHRVRIGLIVVVSGGSSDGCVRAADGRGAGVRVG